MENRILEIVFHNLEKSENQKLARWLLLVVCIRRVLNTYIATGTKDRSVAFLASRLDTLVSL